MINKKILLPAALIIFLASCQPEAPKSFPGAGNDTLANGHILDTSLAPSAYFKQIVEMDSALLNEIKQPYYHSSFGMNGYYADKTRIDKELRTHVDLPPLFDSAMYSTVAITQFYELANSTNGQTYFLEDSRRIGEKIINIIDEHLVGKSDVVFLVDKTSSMVDDIDKIKKSLASIIKHLEKKPDVRLAIGTYGDKQADGDNWFEVMPLTDDFAKANDFVQDIELTNGGDELESVFEGSVAMMDTLQWRPDSKKMILLLGDAGGHLPPYCPYAIADVVKKAKEHGVLMNYYPVIISPLPAGIGGNVSTYENTPMISTLFPVPTDGIVNVVLEAEMKSEYGVYDMNGKEVLHGKSEDERFVVDLSGEPNGIYILRLSDPEKKKYEEKKIILTH